MKLRGRAAQAQRSAASRIRMKLSTCLIIVVALLILAGNVFADSYITFQTTRFYSANRNYFVEVNGNKRATLYRNSRNLLRVWTRTLPELPRELLVTNDGTGVAMVDFYYGNNHDPNASVVVILGDAGKEIAHHPLKAVADLSRTTATTSMTHWYGEARLSQDGHSLIIETLVAKYDRSKCGNISSPDEADKMWEFCMASVPHEHLLFEMATGRLVSRENVATR